MEHPDMIEETPPAAPRRRGRQRIHPPKPPKDPSAAPRRPLLGPQRQRGIPKLLAALPALAVARDKDVIAVAAFLREYLTYHQHPKTVAKRDKRTAMIRNHVKLKCTDHSA